MKEIFALIDMDAFFTSVEESINPQLRGKPVVVGQRVVACSNYEARKWKIFSAMPTIEAKYLCPHLIVLPGNHKLYSNISKKLKNLFYTFTPYIYRGSIDEYYLRLTGVCKDYEEAEVLAFEISQRIKSIFKITASIGIASSLIASKIACGRNKPNGITVIYPQESSSFLLNTPISAFPGIGKTSLKKLYLLNIKYAKDLLSIDDESLRRFFTKRQVEFIRLIIQGNDRVYSVGKSRKSTSISKSVTLSNPIKNKADFEIILSYFLSLLIDSIRENGMLSNTLEISFRDTNYKWHSKRGTLKIFTRSQKTFAILLQKLTNSIYQTVYNKKIQGIAVKLDNLKDENSFPLPLFPDSDKFDNIFKKIKILENKYNKKLISTGLDYYYKKLFLNG